MLILPLIPAANQSLQVVINDKTWDVAVNVYESGSAFINVSIDDVPLVSGLRLSPNFPVMFNNRLAQYGDLVLYCEDDEALDFNKFGITQNLVYVEPT